MSEKPELVVWGEEGLEPLEGGRPSDRTRAARTPKAPKPPKSCPGSPEPEQGTLFGGFTGAFGPVILEDDGPVTGGASDPGSRTGVVGSGTPPVMKTTPAFGGALGDEEPPRLSPQPATESEGREFESLLRNRTPSRGTSRRKPSRAEALARAQGWEGLGVVSGRDLTRGRGPRSIDEGVEQPVGSFDPDEDDAPKRTRRTRPKKPLMKRALDALSRRDHSRKELERKLLRGEDEPDAPEKVREILDKLEEAGYLSDERFAKTRVSLRQKNLGDRRLRYELKRDGVKGEALANAMESISEPEPVRCLRVWRRRWSELPEDRKERDRQVRYLMYRGFSLSSINKVLRGEVEEPDEDQDFVSIWD